MPWDIAAILLALGVVVPLRGRAKMRKLLALPRISSLERLSLYASTIAFQWVFVALVAWRAWARGLSAGDLGMLISDPRRVGIAAAAGAVLLGAFQWLNFRRMSRMDTQARGTLFQLARLILPRTQIEHLTYIALSLTASVCEEFLYRGFAMAAILRAGLPTWIAVLGTAALFGLAHLYQGRRGIITTLALGVLFGVSRTMYGSIAPVVVWHATIDLVGGALGSRFILARADERTS
jgi:membrane protease YdiL (CAAX protease family)